VGNKNNTGVHGIAFDAKVLAIRADRPGSCQETGTDKGCSFRDADVVRAIDYAVAHGAKVINLSLGGDVDTDQTLENAVRRAAQAGVLVVIAAGNEGKAATGTAAAEGTSPTEPAYIAGETASLGRVVAVGAYDSNQFVSGSTTVANPNFRKMADFSNRAGQTQNFFILAPGVRLVTAGVDDDIRLPGNAGNDTNSDGNYWAASGTSFSAPLVAGALALMLDALPNITPENALRALLISADDYTDTLDPIRNQAAGVGVDAVSGVGYLNLARAFSPIGLTSFNFGGVEVTTGTALAPASGALGDWAENSGAFDGLVFQDMFERGFRIGHIDLQQSAAPFADLTTRDRYARGSSHTITAGQAMLSWQTAAPEIYDPRAPWREAPEPTFEVHYALTNGSEIATGRGGGPSGLTPSLSLVEDPSGPAHLDSGQNWTTVSQSFGPLTFDVRSSSGFTRSASGFGIGAGGKEWAARLGFSSMTDETHALGGSLQSRFGGEDRTRMSAMSLEGARYMGSWRLSGSAEAASVELTGLNVSGLWTSSWSMSAERSFMGGALRFTAAQPRRAEGGSLTFAAPIEVLKTGALRYETREALLNPSGRELDFEASWRKRLSPGMTLEATGALMLQPNHVADADTAAIGWVSIRRAW
jgi:hypothetical protein